MLVGLNLASTARNKEGRASRGVWGYAPQENFLLVADAQVVDDDDPSACARLEGCGQTTRHIVRVR